MSKITTLYFISECGGVPTDSSMEGVCKQVMQDKGLRKVKYKCRAGVELNDPEKLLMEINTLPKNQQWGIVFIGRDVVILIDTPPLVDDVLEALREMFGAESTIPPDTTTVQLIRRIGGQEM